MKHFATHHHPAVSFIILWQQQSSFSSSPEFDFTSKLFKVGIAYLFIYTLSLFRVYIFFWSNISRYRRRRHSDFPASSIQQRHNAHAFNFWGAGIVCLVNAKHFNNRLVGFGPEWQTVAPEPRANKPLGRKYIYIFSCWMSCTPIDFQIKHSQVIHAKIRNISSFNIGH